MSKKKLSKRKITMSDPLTHRVVLIGDSQVGKTSLIHRFVRNTYEKQQKNTVGAVFHTYEEEVNGQKVIMQIWDTAGQEKYRSLGPIYYRNASAGVAVFDITNVDSLNGLQQWIDDFKRHTDNPLLFVVGNKTDLRQDNSVTDEQAKEFADKNGANLFLTSAKEGTNVKELFKSVFDELVKSGKFTIPEKRPEVKEEKSSGCC